MLLYSETMVPPASTLKVGTNGEGGQEGRGRKGEQLASIGKYQKIAVKFKYVGLLVFRQFHEP